MRTPTILSILAAVLVVVPAAAQTVGVDQHGRFIAAGLDRVTVELSGFSPSVRVVH